MNRFPVLVSVLVPLLLQASLAHAAPSADLGAALVEKLSWWLQTVVAPALILIGIIATAGAWISGGARQGMMTGVGVIIAGVLCYSGPAVLDFVRSAAGA